MTDFQIEASGAATLERPIGARNTLDYILLSQIDVSTFNPRTIFDEAELGFLADSIRIEGILQPIRVKPLEMDDGGDIRYEIIDGERRVRAANIAGLTEVPAIIDRAVISDAQHVLSALIANVEREDLKPVELARGIDRCCNEFNMTQADIGARLHMSQSAIANHLRMLALPEDVLDLIEAGKLSKTQGISLASVAHVPNLASAYAKKAVEDGWSARFTEDTVANYRRSEQERLSLEQEQMKLDGAPSEPETEATPPRVLGTPPEAGRDNPPEGLTVDDSESPATYPTGDGPAPETTYPLLDGSPSPPETGRAGEAQDVDDWDEVASPTSHDEPESESVGEPDTGETPALQSDDDLSNEPLDNDELQMQAPSAASAATVTSAPSAPAAKPSPPAQTSSPYRTEVNTTPVQAAPLPSVLPPQAPLPAGFMRALVKQADFEAAQAEGLWPLGQGLMMVAELKERLAAISDSGKMPEVQPKLHERAMEAAAKLAGSADFLGRLYPGEVALLNELYPDATERTPEMIASMIIIRRGKTELQIPSDGKAENSGS